MDEFFVVVGSDRTGDIVAEGAVSRNLAHGPARIPHASVQVIPIRAESGTVLLHRRSLSPRTCPGMWDFFGGHVTFEMGVTSSAIALEEAYRLTALREAQEEILITLGGLSHLIRDRDLIPIGKAGQFTSGLNDPNSRNVEYSSVYVLCIPKDALVLTPFEKKDGSVEWLQIEEVPWDDLLDFYGRRQEDSTTMPSESLTALAEGGAFSGFADGAHRILSAVTDPGKSDVCNVLREAVDVCMGRRMTTRVVGVVQARDGPIAMVHKDYSPRNPEPDKWDLPGGGIQADESPIGALNRELWEECRLDKTQYAIEGIFDIVYSEYENFLDHALYSSQNVVYYCSCAKNADEIKLTIEKDENKETEVRWKHLSELKDEDCSARALRVVQRLRLPEGPVQ